MPPAPRQSAPPARDDDRWEAQAPPRAAEAGTTLRGMGPVRYCWSSVTMIEEAPPAKTISLPLPPRSARCGRTKATWSMFTRTSVSFGVVHLRQLAIAASTQGIERGIISSRLAEPMPAAEAVPMGALHGTLICAARPSPRATRPVRSASLSMRARSRRNRRGLCRRACALGRHRSHRVDGPVGAVVPARTTPQSARARRAEPLAPPCR